MPARPLMGVTRRRPARPARILILVASLAVIAEGGLVALFYPRMAALAWILPMVLSIALTGATLHLGTEEPDRPRPELVAPAVALALLVLALVVLLRCGLLLHAWNQPAWAWLLEPRRWWRMVERVTELPICCTRRGYRFGPWHHAVFLLAELAGAVGGVIFVSVTLLRGKRSAG